MDWAVPRHSNSLCSRDHQVNLSLLPSRFKERVLQTPNDLLAAGFEEHKFRNPFNAVSSPEPHWPPTWAEQTGADRLEVLGPPTAVQLFS